MTIELWIKEEDLMRFREISERFRERSDIELSHYRNGFLSGILLEPGFLSSHQKNFVLGRKDFWKIKGSDAAMPFVRIKDNSAYTNGLILTPYSAADVKYHLGSKTIDQRTDLHRVELLGSDQDDFVLRAFNTYHCLPLIAQPKERDKHLLLYHSVKENEK